MTLSAAAPRALELRIPAVLPSQNKVDGLHWAARTRLAKAWKLHVLVALGRARPVPFERPVVIRVSCVFPPGARRFDAENLWSKGAIDGLKGRILKDDGPLYVKNVLKGPCTRGPAPMTLIRIEEVPE